MADIVITSDFGLRESKVGSKKHKGLDLDGNKFDPIYPPYNGMQPEFCYIDKGNEKGNGGFGLILVLRKDFQPNNGNKFRIRASFAHLVDITIIDLNSIDPSSLVEGEVDLTNKPKVGEFDQVAKMGGEGDEQIGGALLRGESSGSHTHFELRKEKPNDSGEFNPELKNAYFHSSTPLNPEPLFRENIEIRHV